LRLGLNGQFWTLLEESLQRQVRIISRSASETQEKALAWIKTASSGIVISGNSMYPTLAEPGYIDVQPYGNEKPRRGDVVHFCSPGTGTMVVHRVMKVRPNGLITQGDNNPQDDQEVIPLSAVDGKVIAVKDAKGSRRLRGGRVGMMDYAYARLHRMLKNNSGRIYRLLFPAHALTGCLHRLAPKSANLKFVFFGNPVTGQLKIMSEDICVGYYDQRLWHINYPWRLWIDPVKIETAATQANLKKEQWIMNFIDGQYGKKDD